MKYGVIATAVIVFVVIGYFVYREPRSVPIPEASTNDSVFAENLVSAPALPTALGGATSNDSFSPSPTQPAGTVAYRNTHYGFSFSIRII